MEELLRGGVAVAAHPSEVEGSGGHGQNRARHQGEGEASCSVGVGWHGGGQGIAVQQLQQGRGYRHIIKGLDEEGLEVRLGVGEDDGKPKLVKELARIGQCTTWARRPILAWLGSVLGCNLA